MLPVADVLALYEREMRRDPVPDPGSRVERDGTVVRVVGPEICVLFSRLDATNARRVVADQANLIRRSGVDAEWKVFGYDEPENLEAILAAEGFVADEPETLVVFDLERAVPGATSAPGVALRQVSDEAGIQDAVRANESAFGARELDLVGLYTRVARDPNQALFVAYADGIPAASARVEMTPGRSFAGLWGGGTDPAYRHRGIYRALVAARASLARNRGYRYLTVDARETSRPILERLGFVALTTTRAWKLNPAHGPSKQ